MVLLLASAVVDRVTITDEPWPNRPWLAVMPTVAPSTWRSPAWPRQLPGELAHLGEGLGGDGLAEAGQPAARVHRDAAADASVSPDAQQRLGLALGAQADVLVPVQLERGRQVVDLGAGRGRRGRCRPPRRRRAAIESVNVAVGRRARTAAESVAKSGRSSTVCGYVGVTVETACTRGRRRVEPARRGRTPCWHTTTAAAPSEVAQMSSRRSGSATIGAGEDLLDGDLLAVPGVRVAPGRGWRSSPSPGRSPRRWRRTGPCAGGRRGRSTRGWWRRAGGSAASRDRSCARRRTGAKKPLGVVSAPTTRATSQNPARICARAALQRLRARGAGGVARRHAARPSSPASGRRSRRR